MGNDGMPRGGGRWTGFAARAADGPARGADLVLAWLGGPQDCASITAVRIGHSMLLAGCDRGGARDRSPAPLVLMRQICTVCPQDDRNGSATEHERDTGPLAQRHAPVAGASCSAMERQRRVLARNNFFPSSGIFRRPRRSLILPITAAVLWAGQLQVVGTGRQFFRSWRPTAVIASAAGRAPSAARWSLSLRSAPAPRGWSSLGGEPTCVLDSWPLRSDPPAGRDRAEGKKALTKSSPCQSMCSLR